MRGLGFKYFLLLWVAAACSSGTIVENPGEGDASKVNGPGDVPLAPVALTLATSDDDEEGLMDPIQGQYTHVDRRTGPSRVTVRICGKLLEIRGEDKEAELPLGFADSESFSQESRVPAGEYGSARVELAGPSDCKEMGASVIVETLLYEFALSFKDFALSGKGPYMYFEGLIDLIQSGGENGLSATEKNVIILNVGPQLAALAHAKNKVEAVAALQKIGMMSSIVVDFADASDNNPPPITINPAPIKPEPKPAGTLGQVAN